MKDLAHTSMKFLVAVVVIAATGCRGTISERPPIHPVLNMDFQERFEAQEANDFFADGRAMRAPPPGTIARGFLRDDAAFHFGKQDDGTFVTTTPVTVTAKLMARGRDRYEVFCTPCHGLAGDGKGIVSTGGYGVVPAPTYHDDRMRGVRDGYLFDVISNGVRTMQGYGYQVAPEDRWAIVAYIRALQRSQNASAADVPSEVRESLAN